MKIDLYDFDKTIYDGDSTIDFYIYSIKKQPSLLIYLFIQLFYFGLYLLRIIDTKKFKEKFLIFTKSIKNIDKHVNDFWKKNSHKIKDIFNFKNKKVVIISASPEFLLKPIIKKMNFYKLIATKYDIKKRKIIGENCYGEEKVNRINKEFNKIQVENAYSDSLSDLPILKLAKKGYIIKKNEIIDLNNYKKDEKTNFLSIKFLRFLLVGVINTIICILISFIISLKFNAIVSFVMGYIASLTISYFINSCVTFNDKNFKFKKYLKFCISYIPNFIIQFLSVSILVNIFNMPEIIVYGISAIIGLPITFLLLSIFAFSKKEHKFNFFNDGKFIILLIYFIYTMIMVILSIINFDKTIFISIFINIIFVILYFKFLSKHKINNWIFTSFVIISLIAQFVIFYLNYNNIESDYATFFYNSVHYANGESVNNLYISSFPHIYAYVLLLGNLMKIIGTGYNSVLILNVICNLLSAFLIFKILLKISNKNTARFGTILWLINPLNLEFNVLAASLIVVNLGIILSFYLITKLNKKFTFFSILIGICIGITDTFRPIMIILIIAIILKTLINKDNLINVLCILITYFGTTHLIYNSFSNDLKYDVVPSSGWSILVGSNINSSGSWNLEDSNKYNTLVNEKEYSPSKLHDILRKEGLERYKNNGFNNINLFLKKSHIFISNHSLYASDSFNYYTGLKYNNISYLINSVFYIFIFILNLITGYYIFKLRDFNKFVYLLFGMGVTISSLLVEVSPRYSTPLYPSLIIGAALSCNYIKKQIK